MTGINKRLDKAQKAYQGAVGKAESEISDLVDFDFSICWQPSDGWTLLNSETSHVAGLDWCLTVIKSKGRLSVSDFMKFSI